MAIQYYMRAYNTTLSQYVDWVVDGQPDTTGEQSGYPTVQLSNITVNKVVPAIDGYFKFGLTGPTITQGSGTPSASAPNGSLFLRTDGDASSAIYTRQSGSWSVISGGGGGDPTPPGGSGTAIQYRIDGTTFGGSTNLSIVDGADLAFGTTYASSGDVRLPQGGDGEEIWTLRQRNGNNTGDITLASFFRSGNSTTCWLGSDPFSGDGVNFSVDPDTAYEDIYLTSRSALTLELVDENTIFNGDYSWVFLHGIDDPGATGIYSGKNMTIFEVAQHVNFSLNGTGQYPTPSHFGGGRSVFFFGNANVNPSGNPTNGAILYVDGSDNSNLKIRTTTGNLTTLGNHIGWGVSQPAEGTMRFDGGGVDGDGFDVRMRGVDKDDGTTSRDVGVLYAFTESKDGGGATNVIGIGDSLLDPQKSADVVQINFNKLLTFQFTTETPETTISGGNFDVWTSGSPPIPGFSSRRAFSLHRHTNFIHYGSRTTLVDVEEALGNGEGVLYIGDAEVIPTTNPTNGVILYSDSSDGYLKYRREDGYVITVSGGGGAGEGSFSAGGDLSGNGISQTVIRINGATVPAAGALTTGHVLQVNGASSTTYGFIADANVASGAAIAYSKLNLAGSIVNADVATGAAIAYNKLSLANSIVNADVATGAAIVYSKLNLADSIVNADVATNAAIAYSKLNLANSIVNADVSNSAAIAYSKLSLTNSIVNADISSTAAIAGSKISPNFGSQNIQTTGLLRIGSDAGSDTTTIGTSRPATGETLYSYNATGDNSAIFASGGADRTSIFEVSNSNSSVATVGIRLWASGTSYTTYAAAAGNAVIEQVGATSSSLIFTSLLGSGSTRLVTGRIYRSGAWTIGDATHNDTSTEAQAGLTGPVLNISPITSGTVTSTTNQVLVYNSSGTAVHQGHSGHSFLVGTANALAVSSSTIESGVSNIQFTNAVSGPTISQAANTTNGATAQSLTISAQNATGTTSTGGNLILVPGSGTSSSGSIRMFDGSTGANAIEFTTRSAGASAITFVSGVTSATITQTTNSTGNGATLQLTAQPTSNAGSTGGVLGLSGGNALGASGSGGAVNISSGTGVTSNGSINFRAGTTTFFTFLAPNPSGTVNAQFVSTVTAVNLLQANNSTASATGSPFTIQAQNTTGATSTGGELRLTSGTGTTNAGSVKLQTGGTDRLTISPTLTISSNPIATASTNYASSGNIRMSNAQTIRGRNNANNGDIPMLSTNTSDEVLLGSNAAYNEQASTVRVYASGGVYIGQGATSSFYVSSSSVSAYQPFAIGTTTASAGALRMENNTGIAFRNAANSANLDLIKSNNLNQVIVGNSSSSDTIINGANVNLQVGGTNVISLTGANSATSNLTDTTLNGNSKVTVNEIIRNLQTTNDTTQDIYTFTITDEAVTTVDVLVTAVQSDGSAGASYKRTITFRRDGGTVSVIGSVRDNMTDENSSSWDCTIDNSTSTARIRVTGVAATTIQWGMSARIQVVVP